MATLQDCIRLFHERQATRPPGTPIRVYRSANLRTEYWRQDAGTDFREARTVQFADGRTVRFEAREADRCRTLAETGEHLGIERVGLIVGSTTETGGAP